MKPETAKKLEAILDSRQKQKQAATNRETEQQKAEAKNLSDYGAKKDKVIKPAFQEVVNMYKSKGVAIHIVEEDERRNDKGGILPPTIRLDMAGAYSFRSDTMKPQFSLTFEKGNRTLSVYTATQSMAGPAGNVALDEITADWIHDAFLKYESGSSR